MLLYADYGIKKALAPRTPKEILNLAEEWRLLHSYTTIYYGFFVNHEKDKEEIKR